MQIDIPDAHSIFIYDPNCGIEKSLRWAFVLPITFSQEMCRSTEANMKLLQLRVSRFEKFSEALLGGEYSIRLNYHIKGPQYYYIL